MPGLMAMDGCTGLSMVCDREYGRAIITSAFSTRQGRDANNQMMLPKRQRAAEIFGAQPSVDFWDIAVVHRHAPSGRGACVRCAWLNVDTAGLTHAIDAYQMTLLPALEELDGFCSTSLMVDRANARAVCSATFASRNAMEASRKAAEGLRSRFAKDVRATVTDTQEFELALAHLHVREMA